jgi:hypothetical protein
MNIILIVTGSISAYKAPDIANSLRYKGHEVRVVMTEAATKFIAPLAFRGQRFDTFVDSDEWTYQNGVLHVDLATWADSVLVAPATANTLAKMMSGVTDNLALSVIRAFKGMVYVAPAMNTVMYDNSKILIEGLANTYKAMVIQPQAKMLACGVYGFGALADKDAIVDFFTRPMFPLNMHVVGITEESMSFQTINIAHEVEIPFQPHPGGFGFTRTHHVHEGADLYTPDGSPVYACEAGTVSHVGIFTGPEIGTPWWHTTHSITVQNVGDAKYNIYGELTPVSGIQEGVNIKKGQLLGHIKTVLTKDKGRPMSMLHLERYSATSPKQREVWNVGSPAPEGIEDSSFYLMRCYGR